MSSAVSSSPISTRSEGARSLWPLLAELKAHRVVDLTHAFRPGIPHWPGLDDEVRTTLYHYDENIGTKGSGLLLHEYRFAGTWGTHVDAPAHFVRGKRFIDEIPVEDMLLQMVVINISTKVEQSADYEVSMEDISAWEAAHGPIPKGSFVALRTDWSKRWPDADAMRNADAQNVAHFPGWSSSVLRYLYEDRGITASGHEATDTDSGLATSKGDYSLEAYVLGQNAYQVELMANLDQVPDYGAIVVVTTPKPYKGTGFPARVLAIVPSDGCQRESQIVSIASK